MRIKRFEHYTTLEIIEKFEEFHSYAKGWLEHAQDYGIEQKNQREEAFDLIMNLLGKDVWTLYNSYIE